MAWQVAKQAQAQGLSEDAVRNKRGADMQLPGGPAEISDDRNSGVQGSESLQSLGPDDNNEAQDDGSRPKPNKQNSAMLTEEERKGKKTVGKKGKKAKESSKKGK
jgi:hypothetical protein